MVGRGKGEWRQGGGKNAREMSGPRGSGVAAAPRLAHWQPITHRRIWPFPMFIHSYNWFLIYNLLFGYFHSRHPHGDCPVDFPCPHPQGGVSASPASPSSTITDLLRPESYLRVNLLYFDFTRGNSPNYSICKSWCAFLFYLVKWISVPFEPMMLFLVYNMDSCSCALAFNSASNEIIVKREFLSWYNLYAKQYRQYD